MIFGNHVFDDDKIKPIVQDGLVLHLDSGNPLSYSGTGLTWYDLSPYGHDFTLDAVGIYFNANTGVFDLFDGGMRHSGGVTLSKTCTLQFFMATDDDQALFLSDASQEYLGAYRSGNKEYHAGFGVPIFTLDTVDVPNIWDYNRFKTWHLYEFKNVDMSNIGTLDFNKYSNFQFTNSALCMIAIYDRNLTQEESVYNFNSLVGRFNNVGESVNVVAYVNTGITEAGLVLNYDAYYTESYQSGSALWIDISGNGNNGILYGGVVFDATLKYLSFDGVDDYCGTTLTKSQDSTFTVWATLDVSNPNDMLFNAGADGQGADLFFSGNMIYWNTWDGTANPICPIPTSAYDGNKHSYVLENNFTENITRLYYDNVLIGTANYKSVTNSTILYVGGTTSNYKWQGDIQVFYLHNKILTEAERTQNFNLIASRI